MTWVFAGRLAIGIVASGLTAFGVSFWVADYVVKANTSSMEQAMDILSGSMDRMTDQSALIHSELISIKMGIAELNVTAGTQGTEIGFLREDVARLQEAVQGAGISIPAMYVTTEGRIGFNPERWQAFLDEANVSGQAPVLLDLSVISGAD